MIYSPSYRSPEPALSPSEVKDIVRDTTFELRKLIPRADFIYREKRYVPVRSSVATKDIQWLCATGEMKHLDGCGKLFLAIRFQAFAEDDLILLGKKANFFRVKVKLGAPGGHVILTQTRLIVFGNIL